MKLIIRDTEHKITCEICFNEKEFKMCEVAIYFYFYYKNIYKIYKWYFILYTCIHLE